MKITFTGRQVEVPKDFKQICEKKLVKFEKFFHDDALAYVTLKRRKDDSFVVELTVSDRGTLFRAEKKAESFQSALDECMEAIERQIRKNKTRLEKRLREGAYAKNNFLNSLQNDLPDEEEKDYNIRTKSFYFKPLTVDEAILQMKLIGHNFYVFENADTGEVNVVYIRDDGDYGLITPKK